MSLSNQWKIGLCVAGIVVSYIFFIFTQDRFTGFYFQHTYALSKPTEAYRECLDKPPTAQTLIEACAEYGRLASQWIWVLALKSTIASYWICDTMFCTEYYDRLRKIAIQLFGFVIFATVCFGIYTVYRRRSTTNREEEQEYRPTAQQPIMYGQAQPIVFLMGQDVESTYGFGSNNRYVSKPLEITNKKKII